MDEEKGSAVILTYLASKWHRPPATDAYEIVNKKITFKRTAGHRSAPDGKEKENRQLQGGTAGRSDR